MWQIDVYQLEFVHPVLREVLRFHEKLGHWDAVITSLYRIGDSGPHGQLPLRAVDLRYLKGASEQMEERINDNWIYDPNRPTMKVAVLHDVGRGLHLHLQVHRNTRRREASDE